LYYAVTTDEFAEYLVNNATGSAYPAVNAADFEKATVLVPPDKLTDSFNDIVDDMFSQKHTFLVKNANLRQTRDVLLPRLLSGELDVAGLEVETGE
jgi:type I restriction enzyme S subunit